jgi:hypothetical protein
MEGKATEVNTSGSGRFIFFLSTERKKLEGTGYL